jgi:type I restriction enzyme, R subunit
VSVLDVKQLPSLIDIKYHTVRDAAEELGKPESINDLFVNFQKYLYESVSVA